MQEKEEISTKRLDNRINNFRKNNGFQRSVDYTREHNIYRQDYCGCVYSDTFPLRVRNAKEKIVKKGFSG